MKALPWVRDVKIEVKVPEATLHLLAEAGKFDEKAVKEALAREKFGAERIPR